MGKISKFFNESSGDRRIFKPEVKKNKIKEKKYFWRSYGEDKSIAIIIILMINNLISNLETDHY